MNQFDKSKVLFTEEIPGGWNWSHNLKRGTCLRITDLEGGCNVSALLYNAANYTERYNMADTLKAQFISSLTKGNVCYSDMGRILLSIPDDICGWHDTISGTSTSEDMLKKYGRMSYQEAKNGYYRSGQDSLLVEIAKYGMTRRDLHSCINFFTKIAVDSDGVMSYIPGNSRESDYIDLQAEMDTLVVLNTCPHPMDHSPVYSPKKIRIDVWLSEISPEENLCREFCEQNSRGFINTVRYYL